MRYALLPLLLRIIGGVSSTGTQCTQCKRSTSRCCLLSTTVELVRQWTWPSHQQSGTTTEARDTITRAIEATYSHQLAAVQNSFRQLPNVNNVNGNENEQRNTLVPCRTSVLCQDWKCRHIEERSQEPRANWRGWNPGESTWPLLFCVGLMRRWLWSARLHCHKLHLGVLPLHGHKIWELYFCSVCQSWYQNITNVRAKHSKTKVYSN